jgi:hypothetical protein
MATSYKALWQEVSQENDQLKQTISHLLGELERTRHVVDLAGIARHMKVDRRYTPQQWRQRNLLPPVDFPDIREPLWYASTIVEKFVKPTRRLWFPNPDEPSELSPAA